VIVATLLPLALVAGIDDTPADRRPVVVTTDCGCEVDDQWALAHLAVSPEIELRGVVTTHAPTLKSPASESSRREAQSIVDRARPGVPVVAGWDRPLDRVDRPAEGAGVRFLLDAAREFGPDRRLTVLLLGAATDVAGALKTDPTWADRVELVAMAFDGWPAGGDAWNVKNDPVAWRAVLESAAPLTIGDAAVCKQALILRPESARRYLGGRGPLGDHLIGLLDRWLEAEPELANTVTGDRRAWPIWDEVTVAVLLGRATLEDRPRPRLRDDLAFEHRPTEARVRWVTAVDAEAHWADLAAKLGPGPCSPAGNRPR